MAKQGRSGQVKAGAKDAGAVDRKIVEKSGTWFAFGGERLEVARELIGAAFADVLADHGRIQRQTGENPGVPVAEQKSEDAGPPAQSLRGGVGSTIFVRSIHNREFRR